MDWKCTGIVLEVDWKWTRSGLEVFLKIRVCLGSDLWLSFARQGKGLRERDIRVLILYCIPPTPPPPPPSPTSIWTHGKVCIGSTGRARTSVMRNDTQSDVIRYLVESTGSEKTYCPRCVLLRIARLIKTNGTLIRRRKKLVLYYYYRVVNFVYSFITSARFICIIYSIKEDDCWWRIKYSYYLVEFAWALQ